MVHDPLDVAFTLHQAGRLDEAETGYRRILADQPYRQDVRGNLFALLRDAGRNADALAVIREALAISPDDADWRWRRFNALAADARLPEAWPDYEARRNVTGQRVQVPALPFKEWQGEPVESLVLWPEQGFGDQIMFARYLPMLAGVKVTLVCRPQLARLFAPLGVDVVPLVSPVRLPRADAWALLGSLPLRFGTDLGSIPPPTSIKAQPRPWRGRLGVVHQGSPTHGNDSNRSLPDHVADRLHALPGVVSLAPERTGARDFQDTADLIAGLDAVITVDTAVAHLAGSLGKPVHILLPAVRTDWRWLRNRSDSPWYPSARLYRQREPGQWHEVIDEVLRALS